MSQELSVAEINALWDKVSDRMLAPQEQASLPAAQRQTDPLGEMLRAEGEMALRYEKLRRRLSGRNTAELAAKLYDGQMALVRRMAAMAFLRSGDRPSFKPIDRQNCDALEQLREYTLWELRQAESYRKSVSGSDQGLQELMLEARKRKEDNAGILRGIIEQTLL